MLSFVERAVKSEKKLQMVKGRFGRKGYKPDCGRPSRESLIGIELQL